MRRKLLFLITLFAATVALMAVQKPVFLLFHAADAAAAGGWGEWWGVVWHGLKLDMTVAGYITALPVLMTLVSLWVPVPERVGRIALRTYLAVVALISAAIFAVDLELYTHWGFRIDATVLIYLSDPAEAAASLDLATVLRQSAFFVIYGAAMIACYMQVARLFDGRPIAGLVPRLCATMAMILVAGLDFLAVRGGIHASVANLSKVYFSSEMFLNHAATNPLFSLLSTIGENEDYAAEYPFFDERTCRGKFGELCADRGGETERVIAAVKPNVVLVILESFARTFTDEKVAGEWVMPHMQSLKHEGVWFENMFANSFRTDRGEVAVMSGYPAQTRTSIMKLPAKSSSLPSIARSLGREGYATEFVYGGDLNFTDQASYMYATGWQRLTWQKDLDFPVPVSPWGWHDDVMCDFFAQRVIELDAAGEPFLAGLLTLSSHEPFEVPYEKFDDTILNSLAFSDECVGRMIDTLKASPAWDNLLVVLIPDHAYPYPSTLSYNEPLRHRIPMLWLGGAVAEPRTVEAYCSQIDLAATLLGQMGINHDDFVFSKDVFAAGNPQFGYYTFNEGFGVVDAGGVAVWDAATGLLSEGSDECLAEIGRVMLQSTYVDLGSR